MWDASRARSGIQKRERTDEGMRGMLGICPGPGRALAPVPWDDGNCPQDEWRPLGPFPPSFTVRREELSLARDDVSHPLIPSSVPRLFWMPAGHYRPLARIDSRQRASAKSAKSAA